MKREHVTLSSGLTAQQPGNQQLHRVSVTYETRRTVVAVHQYDDGTGYRSVNGEIVDELPARYRALDNLAAMLIIANSREAFHRNRSALREWQTALLLVGVTT